MHAGKTSITQPLWTYVHIRRLTNRSFVGIGPQLELQHRLGGDARAAESAGPGGADHARRRQPQGEPRRAQPRGLHRKYICCARVMLAYEYMTWLCFRHKNYTMFMLARVNRCVYRMSCVYMLALSATCVLVSFLVLITFACRSVTMLTG